MLFVHIENDAINAGPVAGLPGAARRLDTQDWVMNLPHASPADQAACGWFPVTEVAQPADTATTQYTGWHVDLVAGQPTQVWDSVTKSAEQQAAEAAAVTRETTRQDLMSKARTAIATNGAYLASTPTQAQALAQVKVLTRQVNGIIRMLGAVAGLREMADLLGSDTDS